MSPIGDQNRSRQLRNSKVKYKSSLYQALPLRSLSPVLQLMQNTMVTPTRKSPNKIFNEQENENACVFITIFTFLSRPLQNNVKRPSPAYFHFALNCFLLDIKKPTILCVLKPNIKNKISVSRPARTQ